MRGADGDGKDRRRPRGAGSATQPHPSASHLPLQYRVKAWVCRYNRTIFLPGGHQKQPPAGKLASVVSGGSRAERVRQGPPLRTGLGESKAHNCSELRGVRRHLTRDALSIPLRGSRNPWKTAAGWGPAGAPRPPRAPTSGLPRSRRVSGTPAKMVPGNRTPSPVPHRQAAGAGLRPPLAKLRSLFRTVT